MSIFGSKIKATDASVIDRLVTGVQEALTKQTRTAGYNASEIARVALATESYGTNQTKIDSLSNAVQQMSVAMEAIQKDVFGQSGTKLTRAQRESGAVAATLVGDVSAFLATPSVRAIPASESIKDMGIIGMPDAFDQRSNFLMAKEAYDEKANQKSAQYTVAYNVQAARQNEFGEAFFPTVTISPDNLGFSVQARIVSVYNDFQRNISGDLSNYNKTNVVRAVIDYTILEDNLTDIVPINQTTSAKYFVSSSLVAPSAVTIGTDTFNTAPLAFGQKFSLIGLSQVPSMLANGTMDPSDSIDPAITLKNVYVSVGTDTLVFPTLNLPLSAFAAATQGNYRQMNIAFRTDTLMLNATSTNVAGGALTQLASIATNNLLVRLHVEVYGYVNVETGETTLTASNLSVVSVQDANGNTLSLTASPAAAIVTAVADGSAFGFDLQAYRTNVNRRQRGQLIDTTFYTQIYPVPLRGPITSLRPVTSDGQTDASDLAALITTTQIRCSNAAVTALLAAESSLASYLDPRTSDFIGVLPDILGVGRLLVVPRFMSATLDMSQSVASLDTSSRIEDIQATLVNTCRDMSIRLYRDSGYQPAADAMAGGNAPAPTVIIGTDPVIANYLMTTGDLRTLGNGLPCKVVATYDSRMNGRIVMSLGQFDHANENAPNPLHFGNMAWKPEMTLVLPISRGGQISKELTVQPSFRHVVNLPVMGSVTVTNLPEVVVGRIPVSLTANTSTVVGGLVENEI